MAHSKCKLHGTPGEPKEWKNPKNTDGIPPLGSNGYSCPCSACKSILKDTAHWTSTKKEEMNFVVKIGDRVLVHGCLPGVVRYIGDLGSEFTNDQVYVGVKLDDPVGNSDGMLKNKRFFTCPERHGVIVPIEQVHILVPRDGRTIDVNPGPPDRFFSMPEMTELNSTPAECPPSRAFSEGSLSYMCTDEPNTSMESLCGGMDLPQKPSTSGECVNRSSVFICDHPGSIAGSIEDSISGSSISTLIKNLKKSQSSNKGGNPNAENGSPNEKKSTTGIKEACDACVKASAGTKKKVSTGTLKSIAAAKNTEEKESKTPGSAKCVGEKDRVASLSGSYKRMAVSSITVPRANAMSSEKKMTSSKSASSAVGLKKSKVPLISKLTISNKPQSTLAKTAVKASSSSEKLSPKPSEEKIPIEAVGDNVKRRSVSPSPPVPKLAFVAESHIPSEQYQLSQVTSDQKIGAKPSYTSRLLSSLPLEENMTPPSASTQLNEVLEFGDWVSVWGGGVKGWIMAQTLQKLRDAQRKGAKEVQWQKTIDELERDEEFAPRIRHMKVLREEIGKIQRMQAEIDKEIKVKRAAISVLQVRKDIKAIQEETKMVQKMNADIIKSVKDHPLFSVMSDSFKQLGYDLEL